MINDVIRAGYEVTKHSAGSNASISYSAGTDRVIMRVCASGKNKVTDGIVQRACMDFSVQTLEVQMSLDNIRQYVVQFV